MRNNIRAILRENPVPFLGVIGLLSGAVLRFAMARPDSADIVWLIVLVVGGAPTILKTIQKMLKGNFAADVVAMLAIITAVLMHEMTIQGIMPSPVYSGMKSFNSQVAQ